MSAGTLSVVTWEPLPDREGVPRDLASVLGRLNRTMGLARPDTLMMLDRHWVSLLGAELASHCTVESLRGAELVVAVDDPAVAEHLRWSAGDLCSAINSLCDGQVVDEVTVKVRKS